MRLTLLLCALVSAGLLSGPADARPRKEERQQQGEQREERREQRDDTLRPDGWNDGRGDRGDRSADAARRAQQQNGGGRVLSVDPEGGGYRVKVLKDGEVRTHHVDVND
jgi:hypothetical protein